MMTSKERRLAAIRVQPVDRLPFYPKLWHEYPGAQGPPFRSMEVDAIHDWIGSDNHVWMPIRGCDAALVQARKNQDRL